MSLVPDFQYITELIHNMNNGKIEMHKTHDKDSVHKSYDKNKEVFPKAMI